MIRSVLVLAVIACSPRDAPDRVVETELPVQLRDMLHDRADMRAALLTRPTVARWMAARFTGSGAGFAVDWDRTPPQSGQPAEHMSPVKRGDHATLRVAAELSGLDQLSEAIYELFNMEGDAEFDALFERARAKSITRTEFAAAMTRHEHAAIVRFQHFARDQGLAPHGEDVMLKRVLEAPEDLAAFNNWLVAINREAGGGYDPTEHWGTVYDSM